MRLTLAIDGGNSKTDVALVRDDGTVLGVARGAGSSPHQLGPDGSLDLIGSLVRGLDPPVPPELALLNLAGVDFPDEEHELEQLAAHRGLAARVAIRNDTFAVLRAGTDRGWGVAVVCGAGINCLGVSRDGRHARFPALGPITGDWGGGQDIGNEALFAAARSEDGRGPRTRLEQLVPAHFGLDAPSALGHAIHVGRISQLRLAELAPVVVALATEDAVAGSIVARLVAEVVAFARVAIERLELQTEDPDVVLGGGVLQAAAPELVGQIAAGVHETAPRALVRPTAAPAILGSALLALDMLGADEDAKERLRAGLDTERLALTIGGAGG